MPSLRKKRRLAGRRPASPTPGPARLALPPSAASSSQARPSIDHHPPHPLPALNTPALSAHHGRGIRRPLAFPFEPGISFDLTRDPPLGHRPRHRPHRVHPQWTALRLGQEGSPHGPQPVLRWRERLSQPHPGSCGPRVAVRSSRHPPVRRSSSLGPSTIARAGGCQRHPRVELDLGGASEGELGWPASRSIPTLATGYPLPPIPSLHLRGRLTGCPPVSMHVRPC